MLLIDMVILWILYQMQAPMWTYILLIIGAVTHTLLANKGE